MVFSSLLFIYFFLPLLSIVYFSVSYISGRQELRNLVLLIASFLFYAAGAPLFLPFLILLCLIDYFLAKQIARNHSRVLLTIGLGINLSVLGYFKYANFFVDQISAVNSWIGLPTIAIDPIALPLGISFFTFQKIGFLVDVYRGVVKPPETPFRYLLLITLFPHLIAGPIVHYHDIDQELLHRNSKLSDVHAGLLRFIRGAARKVLLADPLGMVADQVFAADPSTLPVSYAWLGLVAYAFQIYHDFAGYSDMAIGLARIFGFHFPENFDHPYRSRSVTEFWRRWHISLGNFMRTYLYIPLGGNKNGSLATMRNLVLVFAISGIWHGASWNFVVWGLFHGVFLLLERIPWKMKLFPAWPYTIFVILLSWVLFRADDLSHAMGFYSSLFGLVPTAHAGAPFSLGELLPNKTICILLLVISLCTLPARVSPIMQSLIQRFSIPLALLGIILVTAALVNSSYHPFIYFRF